MQFVGMRAFDIIQQTVIVMCHACGTYVLCIAASITGTGSRTSWGRCDGGCVLHLLGTRKVVEEPRLHMTDCSMQPRVHIVYIAEQAQLVLHKAVCRRA